MAYLKVNSTNHSLTTFPAGNVVQVDSNFVDNPSTVTATGVTDMTITMSNVTSGNKILISTSFFVSLSTAGSTEYYDFYLSSTDASTMGLGATTAGHSFVEELGKTGHTAGLIVHFSPTWLTTAVTTATPSYHIYVVKGSSAITLWPNNFQIQCMEIQQ